MKKFVLGLFLLLLGWAPLALAAADEPPVNPYLADSPWPMTHRNPYCQASSPHAGPARADEIAGLNRRYGFPGTITCAVSAKYPDGRRVIWGSAVNAVFKADIEDLKIIDKKSKGLVNIFDLSNSLSGAYTLVDCDNIFYVPRRMELYAYGDKDPVKSASDIEVKRTYRIPQEVRSSADECIVGLNITWDGQLVFATSTGTVGVVSRDFKRAEYLKLNEAVSNSIACDENGGIYVVTAKKMYRVQWTGSELTLAEDRGGWAAAYAAGEDLGGVRLGLGSGSTPTLMGTGEQDRFVVITDGQQLMHLVLFWRDQIPADWQQLSQTGSRRIAAQVPVRFGKEAAVESLSEQSVCVRGYGALVVNNQLAINSSNTFWNVIRSNDRAVAPYGAEKFEWDPKERRLASAWVNTEISFPNGIPAMSAATNLVYDVAQNKRVWTFDALDWSTGEKVFSYRIGRLEKNNSAYAATEIIAEGRLGTGTITGIMITRMRN